MRELIIEAVRVSLTNYNRVLVLKEKDADRYLAIWIGQAEADAIAMKQKGIAVLRPMTHDLLHNVIGDLGARVLRVVVTEMKEGTYFARVFLDAAGKELEVDARPSDAIALAARAEAPIFCEDAVLDAEGVVLDEEGAISEPQGEPGRPPRVREEELEGMSAFRDFIDSLDLDDFGQGSSES